MIGGRAKKLLIVEDEPLVASTLREMLMRLGYDVIACADCGEDGVKQADALHPELVLMDVHLKGGMDGTEAARQIRVTSGCPVIFLTGHDEPSVLKRARETEPYGYILKPFTSRDLTVQIEMALYRHQMETERAHLHRELEIAKENLRMLRGLLPVCAGCKKVREDDGYWSKLEDYFRAHANVEFSHGICPDCESKYYGTRSAPHALVVERKKNG